MDDNGNGPVECAGLKYDDRHPAKFLTAMVEFDKVDGDLKVQANELDTYDAATGMCHYHLQKLPINTVFDISNGYIPTNLALAVK